MFHAISRDSLVAAMHGFIVLIAVLILIPSGAFATPFVFQWCNSHSNGFTT